MRKFLLLFSFFSLFILASHAQMLSVYRFEETNEISASQYPRKDYNGDACALVKIEVIDEVTDVEGGRVGDIIDRGNEKWAYIIAHQRTFKVRFAKHISVNINTRDYDIDGLKGNVTYVLTLLDNAASATTSTIPPTAPSTITPRTPTKTKTQDDDILTFTVKGVSFKMIKVEGGTFMMGANSGDSEASDWEKPRHQVTLSTYYIGQTEVTQALWKAVMGSNPSYYKGDKLPVEEVGWNVCQTFISKLNEITGQQFSLPTEAEWEFAARGGNKSRGYKYSGSNNLDAVAWYGSNSDSKTHAVAAKQPNELGIYDMTGNVLEWCSDWYDREYYKTSSQTNPTGPSSGLYRMLRGGEWHRSARLCRVSQRDGSTPREDAGRNVGLRLVFHKVQ